MQRLTLRNDAGKACCVDFQKEECIALDGNCSEGCSTEEKAWERLCRMEEMMGRIQSLHAAFMVDPMLELMSPFDQQQIAQRRLARELADLLTTDAQFGVYRRCRRANGRAEYRIDCYCIPEEALRRIGHEEETDTDDAGKDRPDAI